MKARSTPASENESQALRALLEMRELLLRGAFSPGERLKEVSLAERLGVSRTPLRLALVRLEHEGLLEASATVGFVVREFSIQDILDVIELRGVLEGTAARLAAERLKSRDEIEPLFTGIEAMESILNGPDRGFEVIRGYEPLNAAFHNLLHHLAKSAMLKRSLDQLLALPFATPNAFVTSEAESEDMRRVLLMSNSQHQAIAEAIGLREGTRAEAVAREHSRMQRRGIMLALSERRGELIPGGSLIRFPIVG